jgi:hypothetical protein
LSPVSEYTISGGQAEGLAQQLDIAKLQLENFKHVAAHAEGQLALVEQEKGDLLRFQENLRTKLGTWTNNLINIQHNMSRTTNACYVSLGWGIAEFGRVLPQKRGLEAAGPSDPRRVVRRVYNGIFPIDSRAVSIETVWGTMMV